MNPNGSFSLYQTLLFWLLEGWDEKNSMENLFAFVDYFIILHQSLNNHSLLVLSLFLGCLSNKKNSSCCVDLAYSHVKNFFLKISNLVCEFFLPVRWFSFVSVLDVFSFGCFSISVPVCMCSEINEPSNMLRKLSRKPELFQILCVNRWFCFWQSIKIQLIFHNNSCFLIFIVVFHFSH